MAKEAHVRTTNDQSGIVLLQCKEPIYQDGIRRIQSKYSLRVRMRHCDDGKDRICSVSDHIRVHWVGMGYEVEKNEHPHIAQTTIGHFKEGTVHDRHPVDPGSAPKTVKAMLEAAGK
jgi:hypothetical protein